MKNDKLIGRLRKIYGCLKLKAKLPYYKLAETVTPESRLVYRCPCCGIRLKRFTAGKFAAHPEMFNAERYRKTRQDVICPVCGALPRHRILILRLEKEIDDLKNARILYFAQERPAKIWMRKNGIRCTTADLFNPADLKLDIQDTGLPAGSYDIVICNHVLEHVENYEKALEELYRILSPGGRLICSFPVDKNICEVEQGSVSMTAEERIRRFGQSDHLRVFGRNATELLRRKGFEVGIISGADCPAEILPVTGPADYDINELYLCRKPAYSAGAPLVSVIVPVYNVLQYLDQCIESIIVQTYKNLEIILVDDGSTDGSGERCEYWQEKDERVRAFHREKKGLSAARNTGIDNSSGEYIAFVDPDDYIRPEMMAKLVNAAVSGGTKLAMCGYSEEGGKKWHRKKTTGAGIYSGREALSFLVNGQMSVTAWDKIYHKSIWENLRFPEGRVYEDTAVIPNIIAESDNITIIEDELYCYRIMRPGSITAELDDGKLQDWLMSLEDRERYIARKYPEFYGALLRSDEIAMIVMWHRVAQKDSQCSRESAEILRKRIMAGRKYLKHNDYKHWMLLLMMKVCPGLSLKIYRKFRM